MANHAKGEKNTVLYIIMVMVIVAIFVLGTYFVLDNAAKQAGGRLFSKSIKEEIITAENYEEIMDKIKK